MFAWLKQRKNRHRVAEQLYQAIVSQARRPDFYRDLGVSDSLEGRYEMVVAHLVLVLERLRTDGGAHSDLARTLVERFVTDMDDSMRELGVGDTKVPQKVKQAAAGLVERTSLYRQGLQSGHENLARAIRAGLEDNLGTDQSVEARATDRVLAAYLARSAEHLAGMSFEDMLTARHLFAPIDPTGSD